MLSSAIHGAGMANIGPKFRIIGPGPRTFAAMAYDSNRSRTVLFEEGGQSALLGDTWEL
jgi:hypothetical protein